MDIIFRQDKDGNFAIIINDKGNVEMMNLQDVASVNLIDSKKRLYIQRKKYKVTQKLLNIIVDALVINQFFEEYKNLYSGNMKKKISV